MLIELISLIFFVFFVAFNWRMLQLRFSLPPGPFPLPFVGNLLELDRVEPQKSCQKWAKRYGPVFTFWMANQPMIMVTDYELMKEALTKHGDQLTGRPSIFAFQYFTHGNYGVIMASGDFWKEQRRFSLQTLRNFGLGRNIMEEKIMEQARKFSASLVEDMKTDRRVVLQISTPLQLCVGNVIMSIIFGRIFEKGDQQFALLQKTLDENFKVIAGLRIILVNSFPWLRHVPLFGHFAMDEMQKHDAIVRGFLQAEVHRHVKELEGKSTDEEATDFITAYLKEMKRRERDGEDVSNDLWQLKCLTADLMIAGMETTVTTLRWAVLAMIKYPKVQKKIFDEINSTIGREKTPAMSDRQSMPYVVATLNEVQRWGNILPINLMHTNDSDFKLGGYTIPKDTVVIPQISVLAIDEKIFPEPGEFQPERFLEEDGKTVKKIEQFAPFSMGKRQCLGEGLARAELFLIFVHLMQRFQFSVPPGEKEPSSTPAFGFTSAPQEHECLVTLR